MAGLSSIVNIGYHGTSPAIADAIAASGFKGGTFPTWAGKGNIFTSNIDVAKRYGPRQLGVVTSARNLTSPIGGGIGQGGISFGNEIVLPTFDMGTLTTVLLGMLGLGGMRSFEKVKKSA